MVVVVDMITPAVPFPVGWTAESVTPTVTLFAAVVAATVAAAVVVTGAAVGLGNCVVVLNPVVPLPINVEVTTLATVVSTLLLVSVGVAGVLTEEKTIVELATGGRAAEIMETMLATAGDKLMIVLSVAEVVESVAVEVALAAVGVGVEGILDVVVARSGIPLVKVMTTLDPFLNWIVSVTV